MSFFCLLLPWRLSSCYYREESRSVFRNLSISKIELLRRQPLTILQKALSYIFDWVLNTFLQTPCGFIISSVNFWNSHLEVFHKKGDWKRWKISQNSQENTCVRGTCAKGYLLKRKLHSRCFYLNFCEVFQEFYFVEHLWKSVLEIYISLVSRCFAAYLLFTYSRAAEAGGTGAQPPPVLNKDKLCTLFLD